MRENWKFGLAIVAALLISGVGAARADVIDGNWCNSDGRHFSIRGATIITTEGTKAEGNYSRHAFSYKIPSPDRSAGAQVFMLLINKSTVHLRIRGRPHGGDADLAQVRRNQLGSRRHYYPIRLVFHVNAEVVSSGHATPASPRLAPPSMPPGQPRPIRFAAIVAPVIAEALGPKGGPRRPKRPCQRPWRLSARPKHMPRSR